MTLASTTIPVGRPDDPAGGAYDVVIGHGVLDALPGLLGDDVRRVLVVHPRTLRSTAENVRADLAAGGVRPYLCEVPDAEDAKTVEVLASCWSVLGQAGFTRTDAVVGLGGGAVLDPRTAELLAGHPVAFLDVRIADAARRIGFNRDRPLLLGNPRAQWTQLMETRRPIYERVAKVRVETDGRTPAEVADAVLAELKALDDAPAPGAPESP